MKPVFTFFLVCATFFSAMGQVAIIPMPHQEGYFTLDDIWKVNLIGTQVQAVGVQLEVTVENVQHQLVLSASSPVFNLLQGSNRPSFNPGTAKMQYGTGTATKVLRSTGRFPYGSYIVCYKVTNVKNNATLGEFCQEETIKPFSPPELVSPYNGESIRSTSPILTWKPPFPPGTLPFEYSLRVVELKGRQDATEALERNTPLLSRRGIFGTNMPYPGDAPRLVTGKKYAWQISAKAGDFELGVTDVWVFQITEAEAIAMPPPAPLRSYRELKLVPDGSLNPIIEKLRFVYNNRWGAPSLKYESTSPATALDRVYYKIFPVGKQEAPIVMTDSIALVTGINKITIDLSGVSGILNEADYILIIHDPVGKEYFLEFTYYD